MVFIQASTVADGPELTFDPNGNRFSFMSLPRLSHAISSRCPFSRGQSGGPSLPCAVVLAENRSMTVVLRAEVGRRRSTYLNETHGLSNVRAQNPFTLNHYVPSRPNSVLITEHG